MPLRQHIALRARYPSDPTGHLPFGKGGLGAPAPVRVNNHLHCHTIEMPRTYYRAGHSFKGKMY